MRFTWCASANWRRQSKCWAVRKAPLVPQFYTDLTPPEEYERVKMLSMRFEHRDRGEGRPTKRDRRQIEFVKNLYRGDEDSSSD